MKLQAIRIAIIKKLIDWNENLFFERKISRWYRSRFISPVKTVIDVGANKGQSIELFLKLNPECEIFALEPNPVLYNHLCGKYKNYPGIHIFNTGISDHSGEKMFFENVFDYTSSFEDLNPDSSYLKRKSRILGVDPGNVVSNKYPVNVTTLQEFIAINLAGKNVDILKIDTEGHEYYCLKGLFTDQFRNGIKYIQIENHNDDMYSNRVPFGTIEELMNRNNFFKAVTIPHGFGNLNEVVFGFKH